MSSQRLHSRKKFGALEHHTRQVGRQQHLLKVLSTQHGFYLRNYPADLYEILHDHSTKRLAHASRIITHSTSSFVNFFINCIL